MGPFNNRAAWAALLVGLATGCGGPTSAPDKGDKPGPKPPVKPSDVPGHSHERGKMLLADAGKYHALLTAHLSSKDGNELDIFIETSDDKSPEPVAIPAAPFTANAWAGEGEARELQFECAPAAERPKGEQEGTCSHFVAKAPWIKPADSLTVIARIPLPGATVRVEWKGFVPKKYAHHED